MSLLSPSKTKFRKNKKGKKGSIPGICVSGSVLDKGDFGLKAIEAGRMTNRQIEAVRKVITRSVKKIGRLFIRIFPHQVLTKKPAEVQMGSGKGSPEHWVVLVRPGMILFEIEGVGEKLSRDVLNTASYKLGFNTKVVGKDV